MTDDGDSPAFLLTLGICAGGLTLAAIEAFGRALVWARRRRRL